MLAAGGPLRAGAEGATPAPDAFVRDCRELTRAPHRLTGTAAYAEAADYVGLRLREAGVDGVITQEFPAAQLRTRRCELVLAAAGAAAAAPLTLLPMRPNGIIPPSTPPEGIAGPLYFAGRGDPESFTARSPAGCIVVLDYNSGAAWMRGFRLGAKAVVFVSSGPAEARQTHCTDAEINLPRFYYPGPAQDLPDGAAATIRSEVVWERVTGRNVFGWIRGTRPVFQMEKEEVVLLAANLDTFGEVPELSPGARGAANGAALLALAREFSRNRPRRHVLLAFFDGQSRGHQGASAFYRNLDTKLDERQKSLAREKDFAAQISAVLAGADPLARESPVRRELITRLQRYAVEHTFDVAASLYDLRLEAASPGVEPARAAELAAKIEAAKQSKSRWNDLRRVLSRAAHAFAAPDPQSAQAVQAEMQTILRDLRGDVALRAGQMETEERVLASEAELLKWVGDKRICLHASLLLGDTTPRWGLIIGGNSDLHSGKDNPGLYGKIQGAFLAAQADLGRQSGSRGLFELASADGSLNPQNALWAAPYLVHSGEVAGRLGIYNLVLGTSQESLSREGTPDDRLEALDAGRLADQAADIAAVVGHVASQEALSQPSSIERDREYWPTAFGSDNRPTGPMVISTSRGSSMPNKPLANAVVRVLFAPRTAVGFEPRKIYGFEPGQILMTDQNGSFAFGPAPMDSYHAIIHGFAAAFDATGGVAFASTLASETKVYERLVVFPCRGGGIVLPPTIQPTAATVMNALGNSVLDPARSYQKSLDGVVCWFTDDRVKRIKLFQPESVVGLANGPPNLAPAPPGAAPLPEADGTGLPAGVSWDMPPVTAQSAADLWRLDEARMRILRDRAIVDRSMEDLHGRAEDWMLAAPASNRPASEAQAASAFLSERTVYKNVRTTLDDLVHAVLILLALCVPFAYFAERLLVGSTSIYRQIAWFAGIFAMTFLMLFFTHPAFAISKTPIVIFLGFAVVVLSSLVIFIIMRKFEVELKVLQGLTSTVHAADVSRMSTILAAMSMGISTMRRRPLRTALTAVTIILLTFTILCFASFGTQTGVIRLFLGPPPEYAAVQIRQVNWEKLNPEILDILRGRWSGQAAICPRYWVSPEDKQQQGVLVTRVDGNRPVGVRGLLGLDPGELTRRPDIAGILGLAGTNVPSLTVWMGGSLANRLDVRPGDEVVVAGFRLRVGALLDSAAVAAVRDMDDTQILPVDFADVKSTQDVAPQSASVDALQYRQNWATLPVDTVVIVTADALRPKGAPLREINLYVANPQAAGDLAEDLARILLLPVTATRSDGVYRHVLGAVVEAAGARDLLFPILLGGLVILGTMLGSVADREREIYTFSALGLAPPHVAGLFFAEALVYSLLGGLGGYMLAQALMKILTWLAGFGLVRVPEMNYSSTNAIVTILIVMGTVLASAVYPAIKASRSANPGVLRTWRLPQPEGDVLRIVFPFTVSQYDLTGVVSFLREHFDNYRDVGLGVFMARETRLVRAEAGIGLDARRALAPFDLGVTESFELRSTPSEIPGIDEIQIRVVRRSGQPKDWQRLNKVLLDDLRRQFLIWRSLPQATMELYRERTLTEMGRGDVVS